MERARIVLMAAAGTQNIRIAVQLSITRETVGKCRHAGSYALELSDHGRGDRGLEPYRSRHFKLSTDPFFVEKVRDIVGLYLNPPENAMVLCVD